MIAISFNLSTGRVSLTQPAAIVLGADVPVTLTFSATPGVVSAIQVGLGTDGSSPGVLAYVEDFTESEDDAAIWTATLDATDARLAAFMVGKNASPVNVEVVAIIDDKRLVAPKVKLTVEGAIITGPEMSEGGPTFYTAPQVDALLPVDLTVAQTLTSKQRARVAKNVALVNDRYRIPQSAEAAEDTRAYVRRVSVRGTIPSAGTDNVTVPDSATVREAINAIYHCVGKAALSGGDAWFLSTNHNVIGATAVPAFLSAANNGTKVGGTLPVFGTEGATFINANNAAIKLPTGLNTTNFTDIVIAQPNALNYSASGKGLMGNFSASGTNSGYSLQLRDSATPNQQIVGFQHAGASGAGYVNIVGKPGTQLRWQCVAASFVSGTQKVYLDGRVVITGTSTQAIDTTSRSIGIGGGWITANTAAHDTFNGKIVFACKLAGTFSDEVMLRLVSALRAILSPGNGGVNLVSCGDSRSGGTELVTDVWTPVVLSSGNEALYWQEILMGKSNWVGKAVPYKVGVSGFTSHGMRYTDYYEALIRPFRPGFQNSYLFLCAGVNDFNLGTGDGTAQYVYDRQAEVAAWAVADGFVVTVIGLPPSYSSGSTLAANNSKVLELNALYAATPLGHYYIPTYDAFPYGPLYDGLHWTEAGLEALADIVNVTITPEALP